MSRRTLVVLIMVVCAVQTAGAHAAVGDGPLLTLLGGGDDMRLATTSTDAGTATAALPAAFHDAALLAYHETAHAAYGEEQPPLLRRFAISLDHRRIAWAPDGGGVRVADLAEPEPVVHQIALASEPVGDDPRHAISEGTRMFWSPDGEELVVETSGGTAVIAPTHVPDPPPNGSSWAFDPPAPRPFAIDGTLVGWSATDGILVLEVSGTADHGNLVTRNRVSGVDPVTGAKHTLTEHATVVHTECNEDDYGNTTCSDYIQGGSRISDAELTPDGHLVTKVVDYRDDYPNVPDDLVYRDETTGDVLYTNELPYADDPDRLGGVGLRGMPIGSPSGDRLMWPEVIRYVNPPYQNAKLVYRIRARQGDALIRELPDGTVPVDWPGNPLPVIYLPGFLGSEITCDGQPDVGEFAFVPANKLWSRIPLPVEALKMRMHTDGTPGADPACPNAGPAGTKLGSGGEVLDSGVVEAVAGGDIYGGAIARTNDAAARPGNGHILSWDWRRSPTASVGLLNAMVDQARQKADTQQVVLVGHSMGGLLARAYVANPTRAAKVARVVTLGTPYWGAPKTLFPLLFGTETPLNGIGMDTFFANDEMREFARNLEGAFNLYPSASYGDWLSRNRDAPLDRAGQLGVVRDLGGSDGLLATGLDLHASTLDNFATRNGVPWVVVAGAGVITPHAVRILDQKEAGTSLVEISWGDGDGTVPLRSSRLGTIPGQDAPPQGSQVKVIGSCQVSHVPLGADALAWTRIGDYVRYGSPVRGTDAPCPAVSGTDVRLFGTDIALGDGPATQSGASAKGGSGRRARSAATPRDQERTGHLSMVEFGGGHGASLFIPDGETAPIEITATSVSITLRHFASDGSVGPTQEAGVFTGKITVSPTGSAAGPVIGGRRTETAPPATSGTGSAPPAPGPGASPAPDASTPAPVKVVRRVPATRVVIGHAGKRLRVRLRRGGPSVRAIQYRIGPKGRLHIYRRPLLLTRSEARALRFFARTRDGRRERERRLQLS